MIKICGFNEYNQLGEKSNSKGINFKPIINPIINSQLEASSISSYSSNGNHTVIITTKGEIEAIGDNSYGQIIGSLPKQKLKEFTKFDIKNRNGFVMRPISAVVGDKYTLYLVSEDDKSDKNHLALSYSMIQTEFPLFLNIENSNPVSLFGGSAYAASIDDKGSVIFIPLSVRDSPESKVESIPLPSGEKAICLACCADFLAAVDSSGRLFTSFVDSTGVLDYVEIDFKLASELEKVKITNVSGVLDHCFAVSDDGRVFVRGLNYDGQLGIGSEVSETNEFKEVVELRYRKINIKQAFAGCSHSLFLTEEGKIFSCGSNDCGELIDSSPSKIRVYTPIETKITKDAEFCIAGDSLSVVFIGCNPIMSPNRSIDSNNSVKNKSSSLKINEMESSQQTVNNSDDNDNFFIDENEENKYFINEGKIGEGATSITYKVMDKRNNTFMCKKVLKYRDGQATIKDAQRAINEFRVLYEISHPCICKALRINLTETIKLENNKEVTTIALFLEYIENSLVNILKTTISNTQKAKIVIEIAHAMNFIHKKGMIHRDLKIENIMLNSSLETKLVDFGLIKINESFFNNFSYVEDSMTKGVGTLAYMSPEMINEEDYDNKTDVYSFGVVLHVIFTGKLIKQSMKDKMNGKEVMLPSPSESISQFCIDLLSQCLSHSPSKRPSFDEILTQIRENSFMLASDVNSSIVSKRDNELALFEKTK